MAPHNLAHLECTLPRRGGHPILYIGRGNLFVGRFLSFSEPACCQEVEISPLRIRRAGFSRRSASSRICSKNSELFIEEERFEARKRRRLHSALRDANRSRCRDLRPRHGTSSFIPTLPIFSGRARSLFFRCTKNAASFVFFDRRSGRRRLSSSFGQFRRLIRRSTVRLGAMKYLYHPGVPCGCFRNLSNQIAAGEVVERPASVVKELVENALDAHATRIVIEVQDGGRKKSVSWTTDTEWNARMPRASAPRHKQIRSEADLHSIETLGFRGEALPSIGSVSRLLLKTRRENDSVGTLLRVDGEPGRPPKRSAVGWHFHHGIRPVSKPARLKFMRSQSTEMTHINLVQTFALEIHGFTSPCVTTGGRQQTFQRGST